MEEIVGEISDEFDQDDIFYKKLDNKNYIFDGKIALVDFYKILEIDGEKFVRKTWKHSGEAAALSSPSGTGSLLARARARSKFRGSRPRTSFSNAASSCAARVWAQRCRTPAILGAFGAGAARCWSIAFSSAASPAAGAHPSDGAAA